MVEQDFPEIISPQKNQCEDLSMHENIITRAKKTR
jgi:hypothetical protein